MNPFGDCLFDKRENELKEICIPLIEFYPMPYQIVNFERIVERDEELAMVIAQSSPDFAWVDDSGRTLFNIAAENENVELMGCMLRHGADINQKNSEGITQFQKELTNSSDGIVIKFLLD